jgi:hypothetical protein
MENDTAPSTGLRIRIQPWNSMRQGLVDSNLENHWTLKDEQDLSFAPSPKSSFMQRFAF